MRLLETAVTMLVVLVADNLLLGYRDARRVHLPEPLAAFVAMLLGFAFVMLWELIAFISDWVLSTDLQPSNLSTMLDFASAHVATVVTAVLATRLYCHALTGEQRHRLGEIAVRLSEGPSRLLDRHGYAMTLVVTVIIVVAVAALWFAGRPVPGFPIE